MYVKSLHICACCRCLLKSTVAIPLWNIYLQQIWCLYGEQCFIHYENESVAIVTIRKFNICPIIPTYIGNYDIHSNVCHSWTIYMCT